MKIDERGGGQAMMEHTITDDLSDHEEDTISTPAFKRIRTDLDFRQKEDQPMEDQQPTEETQDPELPTQTTQEPQSTQQQGTPLL